MCIISFDALTEDTIIYSAELSPFTEGIFKGQPRQVLAYRNSIKNEDPNAAVNALHLPIFTGKDLVPENVLDWSGEPTILDNVYKELASKGGGRGATRERKSKSMNFVVETNDYVIALINNIELLEETLADERFKGYRVPEWVKSFYLESYDHEYVRFVWALFKHTDMRPCSPLAFQFVPSSTDYLYFPVMDAHGEMPDTDARIKMSQKLIMGSYLQTKEKYLRGEDIPAQYWDHSSNVASNSAYSEYFTKFLYCYDLSKEYELRNVDKVIKTSKLHNSSYLDFISKRDLNNAIFK